VPRKNYTPSDPKKLEQPACDSCGQPMYLTRIEPGEPGEDLRSFECPVCGHTTTKTVRFRDGEQSAER
jgi:predicted RNA-binding Zn-ribbon protein involved in translation (DUF1610 family)